MKKKIVISMLLITMIILIFNINAIYASSQHGGGGGTHSTQSSTVDTGSFEPPDLTSSDYDTAFSMASTIVNTITIAGIVVSIVGTMGLGMKYMVGSVEERAEYKKTMGPVLIGMLFIFASSTIVSIIYNLSSKL